jgi:uncharacterized integral membrane protein
VPKPNLSGAYGIATPAPAPALLHHPERAVRFSRAMGLLWVVRLGIIALLLFLLFTTHVI